MKYVFLPPYSPDYNPIEHAFSAIKADLREHGDLFRAASGPQGDKATILARLHESVWSVTPKDAEGWFRHCSYM